jgi:uncharacterized protein (TIGR03643 family)
MKKTRKKLSPNAKDEIIHMAWQDRCSFERIEEVSGLSEPEVIQLMRANLKAGSFRRWRKRVSGRVTKHRKRFKRFGAF